MVKFVLLRIKFSHFPLQDQTLFAFELEKGRLLRNTNISVIITVRLNRFVLCESNSIEGSGKITFFLGKFLTLFERNDYICCIFSKRVVTSTVTVRSAVHFFVVVFEVSMRSIFFRKRLLQSVCFVLLI